MCVCVCVCMGGVGGWGGRILRKQCWECSVVEFGNIQLGTVNEQILACYYIWANCVFSLTFVAPKYGIVR